MTIMNVCSDAAVAEWREVRTRLPIQVILGKAVEIRRYADGDQEVDGDNIHILALDDFTLRATGRAPRNGESKGRVIVGLDSISRPMPAESCFCSSPEHLPRLHFQVWRERHRQHLYPAPTCVTCLLTCARILQIKLPELMRRPR